MMRKKISWLFLLTVFLSFFSCRNEMEVSNDSPGKHNPQYYVSFQKFLTITRVSEKEVFNTSSAHGRASLEDFEIDTTAIRQTIRNQNVTAFSFRVHPKNEGMVETEDGKETFYNMAFVKKDGTWQKEIYQYTVSAGWLSSLKTVPNAPFNGNIIRIYPSGTQARAYVCGFSATPVFHCYAGHTDPNDGDCGDCWHWNTTSIWCDDSTVGGPDHPTNGDSGSDGGSTGAENHGFDMNMPSLENAIDNNHCLILKTNSENAAFQGKLDSLKQRVTTASPPDAFETQVNVEKAGQRLKYKVSQQSIDTGPTTTSVVGKGSNYDIANMHNHPPNHAPIFSYDDIVSFYSMHQYVAPFRKEAYTFYVVNANNTTYALRMEDPTALNVLLAGLDLDIQAQRDRANGRIKEIFDEYGGLQGNMNQLQAEKIFLQVLNNAKLGGNTLQLYRKDGNTWGRLILDPNGGIYKDPCPSL
ncbi:hypothetical protein [Chryseobacterium hispalense]|uniref:hypothetical protein n=1 Tax=Chryseobacterium hispalense TaxID=1453492 RepID=UPI00391B1419